MVLRTLLFADFFVQLACALALLLLGRSMEVIRGLRWYAWAYALFALSLLLAILRSSGPEPWAMAIARTLTLLGAVLLTQGLSEYTGSGTSILHWGLGLTVVFCAGQIFLLAVNPQAAMEEMAIFYCGQMLVGVFLLAAHHEPAERTASRTVAVLLGIMMVLFVLRAVVAPLRGETLQQGSLFRPNAPAVGGFIVYLVATACLAFALVWMEMARLRHQLEEQVRTDALTGLLNRRALEADAQRELALSHRMQSPLAVLVLDLDHFKDLNDTHGHAAGDAALVAVARLLGQCLRRSDLLARLGGEEFVAVLPARDAARAGLVAERLRSRLEALRIDYDGTPLAITASLGVTVATPSDSWPVLLQRADAALYEAKRTGRNRICTAAAPEGADGRKQSGMADAAV